MVDKFYIIDILAAIIVRRVYSDLVEVLHTCTFYNSIQIVTQRFVKTQPDINQNSRQPWSFVDCHLADKLQFTNNRC